MLRRTHIAAAAVCLCANCWLVQCGPSIVTATPNDSLSQPFDGALLTYAFAREEISVTATYKSSVLSIGAPTLTTLPDLRENSKHVHTLVYRHSPLAIDQPDIKLDGVLLSKVVSSTQDQTAAAINAANSLLTQAAAAQAALAGPAATHGALKPAFVAPTGLCNGDDLQTTQVADITYNLPYKEQVQQGSKTCTLDIQIIPGPPIKTFYVIGYPKAGDQYLTEDYCNEAVCFRLTAAYQVMVNVTLTPKGAKAINQTYTLQELAPEKDAVGFVRFQRRAFSLNSTTLNFTNGMVSEFSANDPSEVVGFLAVPAAALATVAAVNALK